MTLHASAKEFVPSAAAKEFVPSAATLKATTGSWGPKSKDAKSSGEAKKTVPSKGGADDSKAAAKEAPKAPTPAPAPKVAAWGSKTSDAVKKAAPIKPQPKQAAPKQQPQQQQGQSGRPSANNKNDYWKRGDKTKASNGGANSGSWARAAAKPGATNSKDSGNRKHQSRGNKGGEDGGNEDKSWSRGKVLPTELLNPGEGSSDAEKAVKRISVFDILAIRLENLAAPSSWEPPEACHWNSPTREAEIEEIAKADRIGGDVSKQERRRKKENPNDTAPALEDCKPLEVNDETRWKAKVFTGKEGETDEAEAAESKEEILRRALLILNKLSLTKFDKLSDDFINCGISRDIDCLTGAVGLIVNKAQEEQHFSSMYAGLCLKMSKTPMEGIDEGTKKGKKFKKILLERCQSEFEKDAATKVKEATEGITDTEEIEYHTSLIKKHYLGHMRFIGELYNGDLISIKIMLFCLPSLLKGESDDSSGDVDEEKIECFAKLMTVIGSSLEQQSEAMRSVGKADAAENLAECWKTVEIMAGRREGDGPKVSNRIKFMLQDLLEMKEKGWVTRRKVETAKTIAQIHKEVAKEERAAKRSSSSANLRSKGSKGSMRRGASSGDVRNTPQVDEDGFVSVAKSKTVHRSVSMTAMDNTRGSTVSKPSRQSSQSKFAVLHESGTAKKGSKNKSAEEPKPEINYLSPEECSEKAKNVLKEYFVGGDTSDAVLSIHELVGAGADGSIARGAKVVEAAILLVLEMKKEDVEKFLRVYLECAKDNKIEGESFVLGLNDPLEFLNDVAIDAPLAIPHLANIVAELVKAKIIPFSFLLNSPEYFRTDENAATFGAKVMKNIGGDAVKSEDFIEVVSKLMTEEDKSKYSSVDELIEAA
mmetsp:Transcript_22776/g.37146  ORF Transcript_22776/g.37146 Transcript_22776/m.37146 type:complete len:877 (-) Transcript_22776:1403-4033(-)